LLIYLNEDSHFSFTAHTGNNSRSRK